MTVRAALAGFCLLGAMVWSTPVATAQSGGAGLSDLERALSQTTTPPEDRGETDDAQPPTIETPTTPGASAPAPGSTTPQATTPGPPPYLEPGQSAGVQPVAAVARLSEPQLPTEPTRIAAVVAALLAALMLGGAAALRAAGVRTGIDARPAPAASPGAGRPGSLRDRTGRVADDLRDFLRRSR